MEMKPQTILKMLQNLHSSFKSSLFEMYRIHPTNAIKENGIIGNTYNGQNVNIHTIIKQPFTLFQKTAFKGRYIKF